MKEFFHKHRLAIILTGGAIVLYLVYRWYQNVAATNAANADAANQAAAQSSYLNDLLYGQPTELGLGGGSTPASSGGATSGVNPVAPTTTTPTTPTSPTLPTSNPNTPSSSGNIPQGSGPIAATSQPDTPLGPNPTAAQINAAGGNLGFSPQETSAQIYAAEGYTGVPSQDAATARMLEGVGTSTNTTLFAGTPQELAGGGTGAPPEIVAACSADIAAGRQCFSPGSQSDTLAFQFGLPTSGNYELGPNGSVIQLSPGVTPIGPTPEELSQESVYTAPNGVTFINGVAQTGAQLPTNQGGSSGSQFVGPSNANQGGGGGGSVTAPTPVQINPVTPVQQAPVGGPIQPPNVPLAPIVTPLPGGSLGGPVAPLAPIVTPISSPYIQQFNRTLAPTPAIQRPAA